MATPGTPDPESVPPVAGPGWVAQNQSLAIGVAFVLIIFYVAPVFAVAFDAWYTNGFQRDSLLFAWFASFMKSADSTLNQFHKILLPIITALSVIAFRGPPTRAFLCLCAFILFSFVTAVFVAVVFDMKTTITAIKGLDDPIDISLVKSFFVRVEETLLMYLMLLFGISVANKTK